MKNFCLVCGAPTKADPALTRTYTIAGSHGPITYTLNFADHSHPRAAIEAAHNLAQAARAKAKDTNGAGDQHRADPPLSLN